MVGYSSNMMFLFLVAALQLVTSTDGAVPAKGDDRRKVARRTFERLDTDKNACSSMEFICPNGRCIRESYVCDGDDDCGDWADEQNCNYTCSSLEFKCPDGGCIPNAYLCDGDDDCGDRADETNCPGFDCDWPTGQRYWPYPGDNTTFLQCTPSGAVEISCPAGTYWSQNNTICDTDDSVHPDACSSTEFKCLNGRCITGSYVNDGDNDCGDCSDENDFNKVECDWPTGQGYWPYPDDSSKFLQCAPSGAVAISCPAGTYWSQNNTICDTDDSVYPDAVVPTCGRVNRDSGPFTYVIDGNETEINEYPWQVGLTLSMCSPDPNSMSSTRPFCGGSIINELWILTAAHCSVGLSQTVVVGEHSWYDTLETTATKKYAIEQIVNHPDYDSSTLDNDIALIKLATPLTFDLDNKVAPVCPPALNDLYENVNATVTGWGYLFEDGPSSDTLQDVDVPTLTNTECQSGYQGKYNITDNMICAGYHKGGKGACYGDSGGPIITADGSFYRQFGVVSWGDIDGCAKPGNPAVYARITTQWTWITKTILPTVWSEPKVPQIK